MWKDLCCVHELVEGISVTDLLLCNQYLMLMEYLHLLDFPTVHACAFLT